MINGDGNMKDNEIFVKISESLALQYDLIYYVNAADSTYVEFVNNPIYAEVRAVEKDDDFFRYAIKNGEKLVYSADKEKVFNLFDRDNMLKLMNEHRRYSIKYRLVINGNKQYNRTTVIWSTDHEYLIVGVEDISDEIKREFKLADTPDGRDALTGIRNHSAFRELEEAIQKNIDRELNVEPFALMVCDINGLKQYNKSFGRSASDDYLKESSRMICELFDHSPVFRNGGNEFVVYLSKSDYRQRDVLYGKLQHINRLNKVNGYGPVIAAGIAEFDDEKDGTINDVYERAIARMQENKDQLKN